MQIKIFVKGLKIYWKTCKKMHQEKQKKQGFNQVRIKTMADDH